MQLFFIGWNRNHSGGGGNSEEEKSYGRACDISMPVISRSHMSTKIQPTVHRAEVYLETCLSSLRVQSCHLGSECAIEERRLGTGFMTWSCRTMVCLCPRLVCSLHSYGWNAHSWSLQSSALPWKHLSFASISQQVTGWALCVSPALRGQ